MRAGRRFALPLAVALACVAGCATPRLGTPAAGERYAGRLAMQIAAAEGRPAQSINAAFELSGRPRAGRLALASPWGTTLAQASWQPGEAVLVTPQGTRRYGDLDSLAREALGEPVPLPALFDWLRGQPASGAAGQAAAQAGWSVDLSDYLGGRVRAERRDPPPAVVLRVQLDRPE